MTEVLSSFLRAHRVGSHETVLLACSGGPDSTALGWLLHKTGQPFAVAHVNFNLRGNDSKQDAAFVESLAHFWKSAFFLHEIKPGSLTGNIQSEARSLRYRFFGELLETHKFPALLTAHTADDSDEELLLSLFRGDPLSSWLIPSARKTPFPVLRPLLHVQKKDILQFLASHKLEFRTDQSNLTTDYNRNWIRNNVIAASESRFPDPKTAFHWLKKDISGHLGLIDHVLQNISGPAGLSKSALAEFPSDTIRLLLRSWVARFAPALALPETLRNNPELIFQLQAGKKISISADTFLRVGEKTVWLEEAGDAVAILSGHPANFGVFGFRVLSEKIQAANSAAFLEFEENLRVRRRQPGDKIILAHNQPAVPVKEILDRSQCTADARLQSLTLVRLDESIAAVIFKKSGDERITIIGTSRKNNGQSLSHQMLEITCLV